MKPLRIMYLLLIARCCTYSVADGRAPQQRPDCGQRAVALATGISLEQAYAVFGHSGTTKPAELLSAVKRLGFHAGLFDDTSRSPAWLKYFRTKTGIAIIKNPRGGLAHYEYWRGGRVYSPAGYYPPNCFVGFIEIYGRER